MNYSNIKTSNRLKRIAEYLSDGLHHTTRDIVKSTGLCAVSATISELRANGASIECNYSHKTPSGAKVYIYRMRNCKYVKGMMRVKV